MGGGGLKSVVTMQVISSWEQAQLTTSKVRMMEM
jgi:hypothetical protein